MESRRGAEFRAFELRRNWLLLLAFAVVAVGGAALGFAAGSPAGFMAMAWGLVILPAAAMRNSFPRKHFCQLRASAEGLAFDPPRARWLARQEIEQAHVERGTGFALVRLRPRQGVPITLAFTSVTDAESLLTALALGAEQRRASFRALSPIRVRFPYAPVLWAVWFFLGVPLSLLLPIPVGAIVSPLGLLLTTMLAIAWAIPSRVVVGTDGVLSSWLGSRSFVAFRDVLGVSRVGAAPVKIVLDLSTGKSARYAAKAGDDAEAMRGDADVAFADRLIDAYNAFQRMGHGADPIPLLARQNRSAAEWLAALSSLVTKPSGGYRDQVLSREQVWRVVRDPAAPESSRAGAAAALASCGEEERSALKDAAAACANPRVRVALEALSETDQEEEWARALDGIEGTSRR